MWWLCIVEAEIDGLEFTKLDKEEEEGAAALAPVQYTGMLRLILLRWSRPRLSMRWFAAE